MLTSTGGVRVPKRYRGQELKAYRGESIRVVEYLERTSYIKEILVKFGRYSLIMRV